MRKSSISHHERGFLSFNACRYICMRASTCSITFFESHIESGDGHRFCRTMLVYVVSLHAIMEPAPFGASVTDTVHRPPPRLFHLPALYRAEYHEAVRSHNSSLRRVDDFMSQLTTVVGTTLSGSHVRLVRSGERSEVLSEGQGLGILIAASTAAALPPTHPRRAGLIEMAHQLYLGWRRLCEQTEREACQDSHRCGGDSRHECLAAWRWDSLGVVELGVGSAADGDVDAVLGLVVLVLAAEAESGVVGSSGDGEVRGWWLSLVLWTYQSCRAVLNYLSEVQDDELLEMGGGASWWSRRAAGGQPLRLLKLGSCRGGWRCNAPSYHSPAHFRAFRDFMRSFAALSHEACPHCVPRPTEARAQLDCPDCFALVALP